MTPTKDQLAFDVASHSIIDVLHNVNTPRLRWLKNILEMEELSRLSADYIGEPETPDIDRQIA